SHHHAAPFVLQASNRHQDPHTFPTRRSSDLKEHGQVKEKYSGLVERFNENVNDYNELLEENKSLKSKISDLKRDVSLIYESTKEFLKERTDGLKAFKNVFKGF